ncbi:C-type lectin 1, partial [Aphelenchoides avenae]
ALCLPPRRRLCPEGWSTYGSSRNADGVFKCYKVVDYDAGVDDAERKCALTGGVPASIHSTAENDFVAQNAFKAQEKQIAHTCAGSSNCGPVFARLGCASNETSAGWIDGSSVDYANFAIVNDEGTDKDLIDKFLYKVFYGNCYVNVSPLSVPLWNSLFVMYGKWIRNVQDIGIPGVDWQAPVAICQLVIEG